MFCPECGSKKVEYHDEGVICQNCGLIIDVEMPFFNEEAIDPSFL